MHIPLFCMSRKRIWVIALVMLIATITLIGVQMLWYRDAIALKKAQFDQLIYRSMIDIARVLEFEETAAMVRHQLNPLQSDSGFLTPPDPLRPVSQGMPPADPSEVSRLPVQSSDREVESEWLLNRRRFVDRVISGLMLVSPKIEMRVQQKELEEVIDRVLAESEVTLSYEYAVSRWNDEIAFKSDHYNPAAEESFYRVQLFPEDRFTNANYLTLYFPSKERAIYKSLFFLAIASLVLTLAIVVIFAFTIAMLFRQKRLGEIRSDFVSNMTHELKTPISTISLASQMLADKSIPAESKNIEQISSIIRDESKRLSTQVEKVLQSAVFDKGKLRLRLTEVDMNEILHGVAENFAIQLKSRNGKIHFIAGAVDTFVMADTVHITNVMSNLVDNAMKYCERPPEITLTTSNHGGFLVVSVADNGIGIGKADQKKIFEKFYRVPTGNVHSVKGFGLGLSYVKMIAEAHQGYIELESEPFAGSVFSIYLPLIVKQINGKDKNSAG